MIGIEDDAIVEGNSSLRLNEQPALIQAVELFNFYLPFLAWKLECGNFTPVPELNVNEFDEDYLGK